VLCLHVGCVNIVRNVKQGFVVPDDKVILVGRVTIDPPLEQKFGWACTMGVLPPYEKQYGKLFFIFLDTDENKEFTDEAGVICCPHAIMHAKTTIEQKWDEYFIVSLPRKTVYVKGVFVVLEQSPDSAGLIIRSNIKIEVGPGDAYLYIGDFVYTLNKKGKYELTIVDNYNAIKNKYSSHVSGSDSRNIILQNRVIKSNPEVETVSAVLRTRYRAL